MGAEGIVGNPRVVEVVIETHREHVNQGREPTSIHSSKPKATLLLYYSTILDKFK